MNKHRTITLLALWSLSSAGCAGGSSYSEPSSRASATSEQATSGGSAASATSAQSTDDSSTSYDSTTRSQAPQRNTAPTAAGGATTTAPANEAVQTLSRDDQIAQWQSRLAAGEQQFLASAGVCRDVCRATDSICHASRELCALTGDREGAPPTDPRCARARASCERAARQRQESCNVCPAE